MNTEQPHRTLGWRIRLSLLLSAWACLAAITFFLACTWVGKPFPGFLIQENMAVSTFNLKDWMGVRAGVEPLTRLVSVDEQPVSAPVDLARAVTTAPVGSLRRYGFLRPDGTPFSLAIPTALFTWWDFTRFFLGFWLGAGLHLALGAVVLWLRPRHAAARAHWWFCQGMALFLLLKFDANTTHVFTELSYCAFGPLVPALVALGLIFPAALGTEGLRRGLTGLGWALAACGVVAYFATFHDLKWWPVVAKLLIGVPSLVFLGFIVLWAWEGAASRFSAVVRSQAWVIMAGMAVSVVPSILGMVPSLMWIRAEAGHLNYLTLAAFPLAVGYAIVKHQAFDIQPVIRRATLYALMTIALSLVYLTCTTIGYTLLHDRQSAVPDLVAAMAIASMFHPLHRALRQRVDRLFLGERADTLALLSNFADRRPTQIEGLTEELLGLIRKAFQPISVRLDAAPNISPEAAVALELPGTGWLRLGPKSNGMPYAREDLALLRVLADQAAIAFQNARLFEQRVALTAQAEIAKHLAEERQHLLQQVIHDIRSDLFNIQLASEAIAPKLADDQPVASIRRSLGRINDLLGEKSRWLKSARSMAATPTGPAIAAALSALQGATATRGQTVLVEAPEAESVAVVGLSEVELTQVIVNLLSNASKFSPPASTIRLRIEAGAQDVCFAVHDEGPGLPPALLADPSQGRGEHTGVEGDGFGLGNVCRLLQAAGGRLEWQNTHPGALFVARVPRAVAVETG